SRRRHHNRSDAAEHCNNDYERKDRTTSASKKNFARLRCERLTGCDAFQRDEVNENKARENVNDGDDDHAVSQRARQCASRILYFTRKFAQVPPTGKRKERADESSCERANQRRGIGATSNKWSEVGPFAELKSNTPEKDEREQAEFQKRQRAHESSAEFHAAYVYNRNDDYRCDSQQFGSKQGEFQDVAGVSRETNGQR